MQIDPIKPTLKPCETKRLKLKHDELLSNFAFECNLRRYNLAVMYLRLATWGSRALCPLVGPGAALATS